MPVNSTVHTTSYRIDGDDKGYTVSLKLPGFIGLRLTDKMLARMNIKPYKGKSDDNGIIRWKNRQDATTTANRVETYINEENE